MEHRAPQTVLALTSDSAARDRGTQEPGQEGGKEEKRVGNAAGAPKVASDFRPQPGPWAHISTGKGELARESSTGYRSYERTRFQGKHLTQGWHRLTFGASVTQVLKVPRATWRPVAFVPGPAYSRDSTRACGVTGTGGCILTCKSEATREPSSIIRP